METASAFQKAVGITDMVAIIIAITILFIFIIVLAVKKESMMSMAPVYYGRYALDPDKPVVFMYGDNQ